MDTNKLYKKIENYVTGLFEQMHTPDLAFHNLEHTQNVVKHTEEIAGHYKVSENEMLILFESAWFHDLGHLFTEPAKHEVMSAEIMKKFMKEHVDDDKMIRAIEECIMATKFPRNPENLLEEIICDADTYHFGTKDFKKTNKNAFKECCLWSGETDPDKFNEDTIKILEAHRFYTGYCKDLLDEGKKKNLKKLKMKRVESEDEHKEDEQPKVGTLAGLEKDKGGLMSKGIQTMLRLTSENHSKLCELADHNANIIISVNSIIISVIVSVLSRKLQKDAYLTIPTIIFLLVAVTTIVISILDTRPKISSGQFTPKDIKQKKTNLFFFGNFILTRVLHRALLLTEPGHRLKLLNHVV